MRSSFFLVKNGVKMLQNQYDQPKRKYYATYDTDLDTGDGTITIDIATTLERNSVQGYINIRGSHEFTFKISSDGVNYGQDIYLPSSYRFDTKSISINKIQITAIHDNSQYDIFLT